MLLMASYSVSAQVSVGWDASCDYDLIADANGLQQAIDDGAIEIRLSNQNSHQTSIEITANTTLKGGYDGCAAANADNQTNVNSIIDATGENQPAVKMLYISNAQITLDSLTIQNGSGFEDGSASNRAGGLSIDQVTGAVNLNRINLRNNSGIMGGGLGVFSYFGSGALLVTANNLAIQDNTASQGGGGMHCYTGSDFDIQIDLASASTIRNNHSDDHGGGLYAQNCHIKFNAGESSFVNSNIDKEIFSNSSNLSGAGIFAVSGAVLDLTGSSSASFDVNFNETNLNINSDGAGGGVFASSQGTVVNFTNTIVSSDTTGRYGGGLFASDGGVINMSRAVSGCHYSAFCSQLINNSNTGLFPGGGGAMATRYAGQLNVKNNT